MIKQIITVLTGLLLPVCIACADIPKAELNVTALHDGTLPMQYQLTVTIPESFHAYLDKGIDQAYLPIQIDPQQKLAASGLTLANLQAPVGVFDDHVKATVLRNQGAYTFSVTPQTQTAVPKTIALDVRYQLCNEIDHVCFRPQTAQVTIDLTPFSDSSTQSPNTFHLTDRLLELFQHNQNNTLMMFGLMLLAGLLSVATPCIYPMLPITSMFIINRANGIAKREKAHAFAYWLGIIVTYAGLGLLAGVTGGMFNTFMQSAWVNLGFAVFFSFFAISLLGYYDLSILQDQVHALDQHSARVKGLTGNWLMGCVAGLAISPCVGPIVFALLLQIANNIADQCNQCIDPYLALSVWHRLKIASQGGIMMAGFGLGVGLPFFLISVLKFKKLPKAGYWMNKIKTVFGLMILYFAYTYFSKGLGVLGVGDNTTLTLVFGIIAIWIAVMHCNVLSLQPTDSIPTQKLQHFCGVISLILGIWLLINGLAQTPLEQTSHFGQANMAAAAVTESTLIEEEAGIQWHRSFAAARKIAEQTRKPLFIDFYASWCANCVAFKAETITNPGLNQALRRRAVAVRLVDKEPEFEQFKADPAHAPLKIGLPYFAVLSPDGNLLWSTTDYTATEQMTRVLNSSM